MPDNNRISNGVKKLLISLTILVFIVLSASPVFAQGMMGDDMVGNSEINTEVGNGHTAREEAEGKKIWEKLQTKDIVCSDLSDDDFVALGEYFMGQMIGDSHEAMNEMMIRMRGEEGEEQIHLVMGKRLSGCDTSAAPSTGSSGWMPMMQMMWGGMPAGQAEWSSPFGSNSTNNMMNFGYGFGFFGWVFMILWWVLIIAGIVALIKWLTSQSRGSRGAGKSPLDILKKRYAKGEINKKEFEEKKKVLHN